MKETKIAKTKIANNVKNYLKARAYSGSILNYLNPKMAPYVKRKPGLGNYIIDPLKGSMLLEQAASFLRQKAKESGKILFVGTASNCKDLVAKYAQMTGCFYVNHRWLGGTLTNWLTVEKQIDSLQKLNNKEPYSSLSKREQSAQKKELEKLMKLFKGVQNLSRVPDAIIFTGQERNAQAIRECLRAGVPSISLVGTEGDPSLVTHPIPACEKYRSSIDFVLGYLSEAILQGTADSSSNANVWAQIESPQE